MREYTFDLAEGESLVVTIGGVRVDVELGKVSRAKANLLVNAPQSVRVTRPDMKQGERGVRGDAL